MLSPFICRNINGEYFISQDLHYHCGPSDEQWLQHVPLVVICILLYPLGIPAFIFYVLRRYRKRMSEPGVQYQLGFLFAAYDPSAWWFELMEMANKLTMTTLLAFLPLEVQMPAGMAVAGLYMCVLLLVAPYKRKGDDQLALLAETEIYLLVLAAYLLVFNGIEMDKSTDIVLSTLFITMTVAMLLTFVLMVVRYVRQWFRHHSWAETWELFCSCVRGKGTGQRGLDGESEEEENPDADLFYDVEAIRRSTVAFMEGGDMELAQLQEARRSRGISIAASMMSLPKEKVFLNPLFATELPAPQQGSTKQAFLQSLGEEADSKEKEAASASTAE